MRFAMFCDAVSQNTFGTVILRVLLVLLLCSALRCFVNAKMFCEKCFVQYTVAIFFGSWKSPAIYTSVLRIMSFFLVNSSYIYIHIQHTTHTTKADEFVCVCVFFGVFQCVSMFFVCVLWRNIANHLPLAATVGTPSR